MIRTWKLWEAGARPGVLPALVNPDSPAEPASRSQVKALFT
jgi:hypothetical protein